MFKRIFTACIAALLLGAVGLGTALGAESRATQKENAKGDLITPHRVQFIDMTRTTTTGYDTLVAAESDTSRESYSFADADRVTLYTETMSLNTADTVFVIGLVMDPFDSVRATVPLDTIITADADSVKAITGLVNIYDAMRIRIFQNGTGTDSVKVRLGITEVRKSR